MTLGAPVSSFERLNAEATPAAREAHHPARHADPPRGSHRIRRGQCRPCRSAVGVERPPRRPVYAALDLTLGVPWECAGFVASSDRRVRTSPAWPNLGVARFAGRLDDGYSPADARGVLDFDSQSRRAGPAPRPVVRRSARRAAGCARPPRSRGGAAVPRQSTQPVRGAARCIASSHRLGVEARSSMRDRAAVGITVLASIDGSEQSRIYYEPDARRLVVERAHGSLDTRVQRQDLHVPPVLEDHEPPELRVLLDMSVLEVFANDRFCLVTRGHPTLAGSVHGTVVVDGSAGSASTARVLTRRRAARAARA